MAGIDIITQSGPVVLKEKCVIAGEVSHLVEKLIKLFEEGRVGFQLPGLRLAALKVAPDGLVVRFPSKWAESGGPRGQLQARNILMIAEHELDGTVKMLPPEEGYGWSISLARKQKGKGDRRRQ